MNFYDMPIEERKRREFHSFAKMVVVCGLFGLIVGAVIYATKWGF